MSWPPGPTRAPAAASCESSSIMPTAPPGPRSVRADVARTPWLRTWLASCASSAFRSLASSGRSAPVRGSIAMRNAPAAGAGLAAAVAGWVWASAGAATAAAASNSSKVRSERFRFMVSPRYGVVRVGSLPGVMMGKAGVSSSVADGASCHAGQAAVPQGRRRSSTLPFAMMPPRPKQRTAGPRVHNSHRLGKPRRALRSAARPCLIRGDDDAAARGPADGRPCSTAQRSDPTFLEGVRGDEDHR